MNIKVSIVFVNYNDWHYLDPCIASIYRFQYPWPIEIIVADNGSDPGEVNQIRETYPDVQVIELGENRGYAGGMNRAMERASGEYIFVLNGDTEFLDPHMIDAVAYMDQHPRVGMLAPELLNADGTHQTSTAVRNDLRHSYLGILKSCVYLDKLFPESEHFDVARIQPVGFILGAAMLVRRKVIDTVGMFDERFFFTAEEREWCYRTLRAGFQIIYFPKWQITHYGGGTAGGLWYLMQYHRATMRYFEKYWGIWGRFAVKIPFMVYNLVRLTKAMIHSLVARDNPKIIRQRAIHLDNLKWHLGVLKTADIPRIRE